MKQLIIIGDIVMDEDTNVVQAISGVLAVTSRQKTNKFRDTVLEGKDFVIPAECEQKLIIDVPMPQPMTLEEIKSYLSDWGTKHKANMSFSEVELLMDNHYCIDWMGQEWFIPDSSSMYTQRDVEIMDFLKNNYHV